MSEFEAALQHVVHLLLPLGPVVVQRWFGAYALDLDDRIFGIYEDGVLYFRTCDETAPRYLDHGSYPLQRADDNSPMPYHAVPDDVLADADECCAWAYEALTRCTP